MTKELIGWWWCTSERTLPHGDGREIKIGERLTVTGKIIPCQNGLHASRRALDALQYAPGEIVCRVRLSGTIVEEQDKAAASERTVLAMADAGNLLHEFACWCAEQALKREQDQQREPDPRCWAAIEAKRQWLKGDITDEQLVAARAAARAAAREDAWEDAWAAAREDAWAAAWEAARGDAWAAAREAARAAAREDAWAAAWAAAWEAAWAAAWAAAWEAARAAAWAAQNKELETRLYALLGICAPAATV